MLNSLNYNNPSLIFYDIVSYLTDDINPDYKQEDAPYYQLPSPFIYNEILSNHDLANIPQHLNSVQNSPVVTKDSSILELTTDKMHSNKGGEVNGIVEDDIVNKMTKPGASQSSKKRRSSNKDRHSKIRTAHGLRDRRMRLSLDVARPFFKLQDVLGYDKASRTVEWLLTQSKPAIEELLETKHASPSGLTKCTVSSTSDCEVESMIVEQRQANSKEKKPLTYAADNTKPKQKRKGTTKEARICARERARQKTLEKMQNRGVKNEEKSSPPLTWQACEMMEGYNDLQSISYISGDAVEVGEHYVNGSLTGNWNPLINFSYQPDGQVYQCAPK